MKRVVALAVGAVAVIAVTVPVAAYAAQTDPFQTDPNAKADFHGAIKVGRTKATLKVTYSCNAGSVLWISAKEMANGKRNARLRKEGSSKTASGWWQSHRNPIVCDGASHTATFSMDKKEKGSKGKLVDGQAWVQFCVTDPANNDALVLSAHDFNKVTT